MEAVREAAGRRILHQAVSQQLLRARQLPLFWPEVGVKEDRAVILVYVLVRFLINVAEVLPVCWPCPCISVLWCLLLLFLLKPVEVSSLVVAVEYSQTIAICRWLLWIIFWVPWVTLWAECSLQLILWRQCANYQKLLVPKDISRNNDAEQNRHTMGGAAAFWRSVTRVFVPILCLLVNEPLNNICQCYRKKMSGRQKNIHLRGH